MRRLRTSETLRPVATFAIWSLLVLVALLLGGRWAVGQASDRGALRSAREFTDLAARTAIVPHLGPALERGDPAAIAALDRDVRDHVFLGSVVRVKLWAPSGKVLYSDDAAEIGKTFPLEAEDVEVLRAGALEADISDVSKDENVDERRFRRLVEVYDGVRGADGSRYLFEVYQRWDLATAETRAAWGDLVTLGVLALVALWLVQLPLAWSLVRRMERARRDREQLLMRAIDASDAERRRIAQDLHDGPVQDLSGLAFGLAAAAERARGAGDSEAGRILDRAAGSARRVVRQVRSALLEIYPPEVEDAGLEAALRDLVAPLVARGIASDVDVAADVRLPPATERLLVVTAREALRNALNHADPASVAVHVRTAGGSVELLVTDDGRGFDADGIVERRGDGHLGLALLTDLAARAGGRLEVESATDRGTAVTLTMPAR